MKDISDHELLKRYATTGAEEPFAELVRRHLNLVWGAAKRVSGNAELARDVAQIVFTDLARKAAQLPSSTVLEGWLYRAACLSASKQIRSEIRRGQWEQLAMHDQQLHSPSADEVKAVEALQSMLDAALAELSESDRDAVVVRFLAGRSFAEVGRILGTNDDAAQKRVQRALERLRESFRKRGVPIGGGLVAAALVSAGTQAAPAGLTAIVTSAALSGAATAGWGTVSIITLMKSKIAVGILGGAVVATAFVWQQRNVDRIGEENSALRRQVAGLAAEVESRKTSPAAAADGELARLRDEHAELLRLRGEIARLRPAGETDLAKRLQSAEARAKQAQTKADYLESFARFSAHQGSVINASKILGLAARIFATDHQDRFPTTFDEMKNEMGLSAEGLLPGRISPDLFEFYAHDRVVTLEEPELIFFREKSPRQTPDGEFERIYCLVDGSVQNVPSPKGDFSEFEKGRKATAANAPKKP
jgi:RNA polymerase sigma factor (sigma-70 family)